MNKRVWLLLGCLLLVPGLSQAYEGFGAAATGGTGQRVYRVTNLRRAIASLKSAGFWIVGLDAKARETYDSKVYPDRLGIVLGSEGRGLRPLIASECDYFVRIPMKGKISSLNVSVAGAILLYEVLRQHNDIDKDTT